jgi:serine/threonine protein kinase
MDPERWRQIERLYVAASEKSAAERDSYLEQACGPDVELRREVEQLLDHGDRSGNFLDSPAWKTSGLRPGLRIASYEIEAALGAGGMGEVWKVHDTRLNRIVALKTAKSQFSDRFEREAKAVAALNHPNIAALYDVGTSPSGFGYLVMEYVDGLTLADRIRHGPIPKAEALSIARQIAEAIEAAHERGIIHRDLKPANIKLKSDGTVKVLDFGLAKALDSEDEHQAESMFTTRGVIMGTASYMSPEQAMGKRLDRRTDIWSFGVVLHEMLTGKRVFGGDTSGEIIEKVIKTDPPLDAVPPEWRTLIGRCLVKDSRRRLQAIGEARLILEDGLASAKASTSGLADGVNRARNFWPSIAAALAVALIVVSVVFYFRSPPRVDVLETRLDISAPSTNDPRSFGLSPDGRWIVYVASVEGGGSRLWVRSLGSTTAKALTTTEGGAAYPFWSPDSRSIGFFSGGKLKTIDVDGVSLQTVADAPSGRGGSWSTQGVILFAPGSANPLMRVPAAGGEAVAATKLDASGSHRFPQFLPDGSHFIFYAERPPTSASAPSSESDVLNSVYLGTLGSFETKRLTAADSAGLFISSGWLVWVRAGTLVGARLDEARQQLFGDAVTIADSVFTDTSHARLFSVSDNGLIAYRQGASEPQLTWFDRTGKSLGALTPPGANANDGIDRVHSAPRISPDGRRVAVNRRVAGNTDIWILDEARSNRFTFEGGSWPVWSHDGTEIVFCAIRNGKFMAFRKRSDGTGPESAILDIPRWAYADDFSPDGRFLLYQTQEASANGYDLWITPVEGERKSWVFLQTKFDEKLARFSPDGRWVAYVSNESGRAEVYVRAFTGTPPSSPPENSVAQLQVSLSGGLFPAWSHDGKELYWVGPDGRMMAATLTQAGKTLQPGPPLALFQSRINGGGLDVNTGGRQFDVAPDGRFLINTLQQNVATSITLLQNWKPPR